LLQEKEYIPLNRVSDAMKKFDFFFRSFQLNVNNKGETK